ncbi:MAG: hypothetical protein ACM3TN_09400 [Alphaproteobacteria bacterium]
MMARLEINWKLDAYSKAGALNQNQINSLAAQFGFDTRQLAALSVKLGRLLHPRFQISGIAGPMARLARGPKELEKGLAKLRRAEKSLADALEHFDQLTIIDPHGRNGSENPFVTFRHRLRGALGDVQRIHQIFRKNAATRSVSFDATPDRRMVRDERRSSVCYAVFHFWKMSGRKLTFSTDTISGERKGALFDFVNAITACVTDPAAKLSGHTIYDELKAYTRPIAPTGPEASGD